MEEKKFEEAMNKLQTMSDELKKDRDAFNAERQEFEKRQAEMLAPKKDGKSVLGEQVRAIVSAMQEKRAITLSGAGAVEVIGALVKVFKNRTSILDGLRYFYGPNSATVIPILNPRPARPSRVAEGVTNASSDSTAALGATRLEPETYFSELPVSFESLKYLPFDFEAQLVEIFGDAFADAMAAQVVTGRGKTTYYEFAGLFTSVPSDNQIACAAAGAPTIADLVKLALKMKDKVMANPTIAISSTFYAAATTGTVQGYDVYRNELIMNGSIQGVKVEVTGYAPTSTSANAIVAVGFDKGDYAVGIGAEIAIRPINKVGDTNTYYQAIMGMDGKPIIAANTYALKAISG